MKRYGQNSLSQLLMALEVVVLGLLCGCLNADLRAQQAPSLPAALPIAANQPSPTDPGQKVPDVLHIAVGHSVLIKTPARVKRILTGNPAVLESVLTPPNEVVVTAKQTGGSSLLLWDQDGKDRMVDVYADVDVNPLLLPWSRPILEPA